MATILLLPAARAQLCKWVDDKGVVHYTPTCPEGVEAEQVEISAAPVAEAPVSGVSTPPSGRDPDRDARSLPWQRLAPRPEHTQSRYLKTTSAMMQPIEASLGGQFIIRLTATERLMSGALLEARFPDPANPGQATYERFEYEGLTPMIRLASRPAREYLCWNYHVVVYVYRDTSKSELLDTHEQIVPSRYDLTGIRDGEDFAKATSRGSNCPGARRVRTAPDYSSMTARQLDAECERAREALLKPEREQLIRLCITAQGKDAGWCETYYSDHGAARRDGYTMRMPKYSDLPVCVAAREAWRRED